MQGHDVSARPRGVLGTLAWMAKSPSQFITHREYLWQQSRERLGFAPSTRHQTAGKLHRLPPWFLDAHGEPLDRPRVMSAETATHMRGDDTVLGVVFDGVARAYPWWIMDDHHLGNDVVGGRRITIMLCEMCCSGIAFDPVVDGEVLTFRLAYLYNGTVCFQDDQTGSVWSPYFSMAIRGRLAGTRLEWLPLSQMSWESWRELHPGTDVVAPEHGSREGHGSEHHLGNDYIPPGMGRLVANWDDRLPKGALVLGVLVAGHETVYPLDWLRDECGGVRNDEVGDRPVVVLAHMAEGSDGALAYSRRIGDRLLTFSPAPGGAVDAETGSTWTYEGEAVSGPLTGSRLEFVPSHVSEWFIWVAHFPGMRIAAQQDTLSDHL